MARLLLILLLTLSAWVPIMPASPASAAAPCHGAALSPKAHGEDEHHGQHPLDHRPERPPGHDCIGCVASPLQLSARPVIANRLLIVTQDRSPAAAGRPLLSLPPEPPPPRFPA